MGATRLAAIRGPNPDVVARGCLGRLLQIPVRHTVQFLADAYTAEEMMPPVLAAAESPISQDQSSVFRGFAPWTTCPISGKFADTSAG